MRDISLAITEGGGGGEGMDVSKPLILAVWWEREEATEITYPSGVMILLDQGTGTEHTANIPQ